jgi:hypothetical protein
MSVIESTTGHNRVKEKNIARLLYIVIVAAVIIGAVAAIMAGRNHNSLNPYTSDSPNQVAPDRGTAPAAPAAPTAPSTGH